MSTKQTASLLNPWHIMFTCTYNSIYISMVTLAVHIGSRSNQEASSGYVIGEDGSMEEGEGDSVFIVTVPSIGVTAMDDLWVGETDKEKEGEISRERNLE